MEFCGNHFSKVPKISRDHFLCNWGEDENFLCQVRLKRLFCIVSSMFDNTLNLNIYDHSVFIFFLVPSLFSLGLSVGLRKRYVLSGGMSFWSVSRVYFYHCLWENIQNIDTVMIMSFFSLWYLLFYALYFVVMYYWIAFFVPNINCSFLLMSNQTDGIELILLVFLFFISFVYGYALSYFYVPFFIYPFSPFPLCSLTWITKSGYLPIYCFFLLETILAWNIRFLLSYANRFCHM